MAQKPSKAISEKGAQSSFGETLGKVESRSEKNQKKESSEDKNETRAQRPPQKEIAKDTKPKTAEQKPQPKENKEQSASKEQSRQEQNTQEQKEPQAKLIGKDAKSTDKLTDKLNGEAKANPEAQEQGQVEEAQLDAEALPAQPNAPTLNGPISDRLLNLNPLTEPNIAIAPKAVAPQQEEQPVDGLTRRAVWNDFLRKMKDDLGVDAEDMVQAFATLTPEELAQPPAETVSKVVAALGLDPNQAMMAKNYLADLVNKTQSKSLGEELKTSTKQVNLAGLSKQAAQQKTLNTSLEQMNNNFFMQGQPAKEDRGALLPFAPVAPQATEMLNVTAAPVAGPMSALASELKAPTANFEALDNVAPSEIPVKSEKSTVDELVKQFMMPQAKTAAIAPAVAGEVAKPVAAPTAPVLSPNVSALKAMFDDAKAGTDSQDDEGGGEFTSDASQFAGPLGAGTKLNGLNNQTQFQGELSKAAPQMPVHVAELAEKAQVLVHNGGGEMKINMNAEGMGEVAMKVSVQDGKVQVQMITESDEAKKMLERGLGDLKTSLHSSHLQLDTIKIDTAQNLGKQMEQQYQDSQRQATASAWEQFRQDNQGWRRNQFEVGSAKMYQGQGKATRDVQAPTASSNSTGDRRLNLVA